jgi:hypothetical protein
VITLAPEAVAPEADDRPPPDGDGSCQPLVQNSKTVRVMQ